MPDKTPLTLIGAACLLGFAPQMPAMQITGYDPVVHDRFASGFPANPVRNGDPNFIGHGFDWTPAGWNAGNARAGYGFLSPRHHLLARHFTSNNNRRIFGNDGVVHTVAHENTLDLGFGADVADAPDLSITRLAQAFPESALMPRVPILDLHGSSTSNTTSAYTSRNVFLYGHWGRETSTGSTRIAQTPMASATASGSNHSFTTSNVTVQLEGNDSGSPAYMIWTDPDGGRELAMVGNHAAITATTNIHNFAASHQVMAAINTVMTADGYALRVEGESQNTWAGSTRNAIGDRRSWDVGLLGQAPSDRFVTFDGATAGSNRVVDVNSNHNLRGLYFRNTGGSAAGFTFSGGSVLTIGRGGVNNLDTSRQVFAATIALGDHQYWDAGAGGVTLQAVQTNGRLLSLRSPGESTISGLVSGTGGIALEGGVLRLDADASYTGKTWVHGGELRVDGDIRSSERLVTGPSGTLTGAGKISIVAGQGALAPNGILSVDSLDPSGGMRFHFVLGAEGPAYGSPASSPNDVLRVSSTPTTALVASNQVSIYLAENPPATGQVIEGGFFFDDPGADPAQVGEATYQVFVADPAGEVAYRGQTYAPRAASDWTVVFAPVAADFIEGTIDGLAMRIEFAATAGNYAAWAAAVFPADTPEADTIPDAAPFGDGIPNLLAYALALDPLANKAAGMPVGEIDGNELRYRYRRNLDAQDLDITVETSDDLVQWVAYDGFAETIDPDADGDGAAEILEAQIPAAPGQMRQFARLRVSFAP